MTVMVVYEVLVRRGRGRGSPGAMVGSATVADISDTAVEEAFAWRRKGRSVGTTGGALVADVRGGGFAPPARTVRVQLSCEATVVVPRHRVTVLVLQTVRSLSGGGGAVGVKELTGAAEVEAVTTAVVVAVTVTVTISSAWAAGAATGLPMAREPRAKRPRS